MPWTCLLLGTWIWASPGVTVAPAPSAWSYEDLDYVLERYVSERGLVDYDGLVKDRASLDRFVRAVEETSPDSRPELFPRQSDRLAYWINAYNALVLRGVVEAWPVRSVKDIRPLFGFFWRDKHRLGGQPWTLRKLENEVLRARFREPRIHFAINCASRGCPALRRRAWRADSLDGDLEEAARTFIRDPRNVRVDPERGTVHLSEIFKWYPEDFLDWLDARGLPRPRGVLGYVIPYLSDDQRRGWDPGKVSVAWIEYDWSVNAEDRAP
jgi:hypothetical protein